MGCPEEAKVLRVFVVAARVPRESPGGVTDFSRRPGPVAVGFGFRPGMRGKSAILGLFFAFFFVVLAIAF